MKRAGKSGLARLAPGLAVIAAFAATAAPARDYSAPGLTIRQPWSRPAAAGGTGAGFAVIINTGADPVTLVSVSSPRAAKVELHQTVETGGVYSMRSFPEGVVIPPHGRLELAPGGYHIMMAGLKARTLPDQTLPATLTFRRGGRAQIVRVEFTVQLAPPQAAAGGQNP